MANFSQSFTGKGTAVVLPESGALKAQEGLSRMVLDAEKLRYEVYQKNRSEFLKNAKIDPFFVLSTSAREYVNGLITNFNQTYGKIAQETKYNLSQQQQMDMQRDHDFIVAEQQNQKAQQERAMATRDWVAANPEKADYNKFTTDLDKFNKSGIYDGSTMPIKSKSPIGYFNKFAEASKAEWGETPVTAGGERSFATYPFDPNNPKSVYRFFQRAFPGMPYQEQLGMIEEWNAKAPKEEYLKRADLNNDGTYDENEKQNAILLWASENPDYINTVKEAGRKLSAFKDVSTGITTGFDPKRPVSATNNKNDFYDMQEALSLPTKYGVAKLPDYMPISTKNPTPIFLTISDYYSFDEQGRTSTEKFDEAQSVSVEVLGYSPGRDMLIVKATSSGTGKTPIFQGNQLAIDAAKYDKYLKSTFGLWREGFKSRRITEGTFVTPRMEQPTQTKSVGGINIEIKQPPKSGLKWE